MATARARALCLGCKREASYPRRLPENASLQLEAGGEAWTCESGLHLVVDIHPLSLVQGNTAWPIAGAAMTQPFLPFSFLLYVFVQDGWRAGEIEKATGSLAAGLALLVPALVGEALWRGRATRVAPHQLFGVLGTCCE